MRHFIVFAPMAIIVLLGAGLCPTLPESSETNSLWAKESVWETVMASPDTTPPLSPVLGARGTVLSIEKDLGRFTMLLPGGQPLLIQMEMRSSLRLAGNEVEIWDLRLGDKVTVAYRVEDGRNIARTVTVER